MEIRYQRVKVVLATLTSLIVFIVGWIVIALVLGAIGFLAARARDGLGLLHIIHAFLIYVCCPGIGSFFAVHVTSSIFVSVDSRIIYMGFVYVASVLVVIGSIVNVVNVLFGISSVGIVVLFVFQIGALFLGARIGKACVDDGRSATSGDYAV